MVDYLLDVVPVVDFALDDGPLGFEVFQARDNFIPDEEVVQVGVD